MLKITFDTNCIINLLDASSSSAISVSELLEIMRYAMEGTVNIAVTTRVEYDLSKDKDHKRKDVLLKQIGMFPTIASGARWDMSNWDNGDFWTDKKYDKLTKEIQEILFPNLNKEDKHYTNKLSDIDHLASHISGKRDIFVTDDTDVLKKSTALKEKFGVNVLTPKHCLEKVISSQSPLPLVTLFKEKWTNYVEFIDKFTVENPNITKDDNLIYEEFHMWFKRNFPKIKNRLGNFRLEMNSQNIGKDKFIVDDDIMTSLQQDINPFENYYASLTLRGALTCIEEMFREARPYDAKHKDWVKEHMNALTYLLIEFEGYLE